MDQKRKQVDVTPAILVTGGSGFVGQHLVKDLAKTGRTVVSMYHHRLPEPIQNVFPVCSDMGSAELLAAPLRGVDTVVHLAWGGGLIGPSEELTWDPLTSKRLSKNLILTRNLIAAMEKAGTQRIIFMSALGANRNARVPFLIEKYLAEFFILNSNIPDKVILRSSMVWGGEGSTDKFLRSITRLMRMPVFYPVPKANGTVAPIAINDLVATIAKLLTCQEANNNSVIADISGSESYRLEELFKLVNDHYLKGVRWPVRGVIGNSLVPLFERNGSDDPRMPRLRHFLALAGKPAAETGKENPLTGVLPTKFTTFKEMMTKTPEPQPQRANR